LVLKVSVARRKTFNSSERLALKKYQENAVSKI
jgi:hypothetical protein